ncbi:MAG: FeoA family protein [Methermicoccaceae archaeon]
MITTSSGEIDELTLDNVNEESKVRVIHIKGRGAARKRVLDMGFVPGVEVEVIKKAPLGDPIEFKLKGYHLSLRKKEAETIVVEPVEV